MTLVIEAPCDSTYLQGIKEEGHVAVYIDKVLVLVVAFQFDDKNHSWEKSCGSIERVFIYDAPTFVKYDDHNRNIKVQPVDKSDKGLHQILIEIQT